MNVRLEPMRMSDKMTVTRIVHTIARTGTKLVSETVAKDREKGTPESRAKEKSWRLLVVTTFVAQKSSARVIYATRTAVPGTLWVALSKMAIYGWPVGEAMAS